MIHNDWFLRKLLEEPSEYLATGWRYLAWLEAIFGAACVAIGAVRILGSRPPDGSLIAAILYVMFGGAFVMLPGVLTLRKRRLWPQSMPLGALAILVLVFLHGLANQR